MNPSMHIDLDTRTQEILLAASNHDLDALKPFLRTPGAASVQDPETGFTPLHAAIAACEEAKIPQTFVDLPSQVAEDLRNILQTTTTTANTDTNKESEGTPDEVDLEKAKATVHELFLSGAIWNDLDNNDETPGCLAWRLGQKELYELVVEAGVRAEMLMNLMGGYEELDSADEEDREMLEEMEGSVEIAAAAENKVNEALASGTSSSETAEEPLDAAVQQDGIKSKKDVNSADYLKSDLEFTDSTLLDSDKNGVMMDWETPIMSLTSSLIAPNPGLRILNIGFGMGIVDSLFASTSPSSHHIIEAHPAVIQKLESDSCPFGPAWQAEDGGSKNVVHKGRWQDVIPKLLEQDLQFDAIYFDTFGESYMQLKYFFSEHVISLLSPDGKFSFFNGLGADRRVCYDVYCRVAEVDLCDAGFDVDWYDIEVDMDQLEKEGQGEWEGVKRRYWTLDTYRLPVARFMG